MQQLGIRRGDTLYAECQLVDHLEQPKPITGMTVRARLVDLGGNVAHEFSTTVLNETEGKFALNSVNTSTIPPALYSVQIKYQVNGAVISSTAFELLISKQVTTEPTRFAHVGSVVGNTRVQLTLPATPIDVSLWDVDWDVAWA